MQGRNGYTDVGNGLVDTLREGESGMKGECSIDIYTLSGVRQLVRSCCVTQGHSLAFYNDLEGWSGAEERVLGLRGCLYNYG